MANIGDIIELAPSIHPNEKNESVDKIFRNNFHLQGIVVLHNEKPIGLVTRTSFYQQIGTLYGYNLYMGRSVELLAKKNPLIVDYKKSITEVSQLAMGREPEDMYDYVIVTKNGKYKGIVSIQSLLLKLVEIQAEFASFLNPLTNLPGNHIIDAKLRTVIQEPHYSIFYFDLNHFKAYNDTHGFKKGDKLLLTLSKLLKSHFVKDGAFLGHVGGDDFIGIQKDYHVQPLCEKIIKEFNEMIKHFYSENDLRKQYVIIEGRSGKTEKIPLVSLSISIVTNECTQYENIYSISEALAKVKKRCKALPGSNFLINET